ncbi:MAG: hypothetical protein QOI80_306 [Solirubrobacteraceae bacterium]|jgi:hypothetical protein|nr:hypothetical protein [Solirubrobacteraceae bacterium]
MDIFGFTRDSYRFPGRAGALQNAGAAPAMLAELGDNYRTYHEHLAEELERTGGRPDPEDFGKDYAGYAAAVDRVVDLVKAESVLRLARAWRVDGVPLGTEAANQVPLLDERLRLVAVAGDDHARATRRGDPAAAQWTPPKPEPIMDLGEK